MLEMRSVIGILEERAQSQGAALREDWERTRWAAMVSMQPHLKKGTTLKPTDLIKFEWDKKKQEAKQTTAEEKAAKWAKWDAEMKAKYQKNNGEHT